MIAMETSLATSVMSLKSDVIRVFHVVGWLQLGRDSKTFVLMIAVNLDVSQLALYTVTVYGEISIYRHLLFAQTCLLVIVCRELIIYYIQGSCTY